MKQAEFSVDGMPVRVQVSDKAVIHVDLLPLGRSVKAVPSPKDALLKRAVRELKEYLHGRRKRFTVPVEQAGTPFQHAIYKALCKVPYGRVLSYGDLAREAGKPRAARAVGSAMNRNQVPLIVPCHRVVASNGLGGFGCGIAWKKRLLDLERG